MAKTLYTRLTRAGVVTLLLAVPLLSARSASAGPLTEVQFDFPLSYQYIQFGPAWGFAWSSGGFQGNPDDGLSGFPISGGTFELHSGPLTEIIPGAPDSFYVHDAGGFIDLTFDLEVGGFTHTGSFFAPLEGLTIRADNGRADAGDVQFAIGTGLFDQRTAKLLGIKRATLPSNVFLFADTLSDFADPHREVAAFGYMVIRAEVPEPSSLLLAAVAGLAAVLRRMGRNGGPRVRRV